MVYARLVSDDDYRTRFGYRTERDGGKTIHEIGADGDFVEVRRLSLEDYFNSYHYGFDPSGRKEYWVDTRGRDTNALVVTDHDTGTTETLASNEKADISDLLAHPRDEDPPGRLPSPTCARRGSSSIRKSNPI